MRNGDIPIIDTLLDNDWYQFKMAQFFLEMGHRDQGVYNFTDRKEFRLGSIIDFSELNEQIDHLFSLTLGFRDSEFIHKHGINENTIDEINKLRKEAQAGLQVCTNGTNLIIRYQGPLPLYVLYETPILAIVNELYSRAATKYLRAKDDQQNCLESRLAMKLKELRAHPELKFVEFGTRRRYSSCWQKFVIERLEEELSPTSFLGSSNVLFSKMIGRAPRGTMAHQVPMLYAAKALGNKKPTTDEDFDRIRMSQIQAINDWSNVWGLDDTFWLTDTFTTKWFVDYTKLHKINPRQDSGDPIRIGNLCKKNGAKKIMFSDGLDLSQILDLQKTFGEQMDCFYGWGTDLSNDGLIAPLSIVIKLFSVNGIETVKLGDGVGKEMGRHAEKYRQIFSV